MLPLLLTETELFEHFQSLGTPLPFSLSSLQKDRTKKMSLGGIPYHKISREVKYNPAEVSKFINKLPVFRGSSITKHRAGRPSKAESQLAKDLGLTVFALRSRKASERKSTN